MLFPVMHPEEHKKNNTAALTHIWLSFKASDAFSYPLMISQTYKNETETQSAISSRI